MAIMIDELCRIFTLHTKHTTYQMKADAQDVLLHTYYGEKTDNSDKSLLFSRADRGFSFVYSGEFLIEAEKDQLDRTRLICGIHPDNFSWTLHRGAMCRQIRFR